MTQSKLPQGRQARGTRVDAASTEALGTFHGIASVALDLPTRRIELVELASVACGSAPDCTYRVFRSTDPAGLFQPTNALGVASGNAFEDPRPGVLADGGLYFYGLDDGSGRSPTLRARRSATVTLSW